MGRSDDKQNDILCAAISEFADKGIMATTMESIACQASVSKRTLYKHYPNKEALFDTVVDLLLERIDALKQMQYDNERPLIDQLRELATFFVRLSEDDDHLHLARIAISESIRSEEQATRLNAKFLDCERGVHQWFTQAAEAGVLGDISPALASTLFYGALKQQCFWDRLVGWKPKFSPQESQELIEVCCNYFINGLKLDSEKASR